MMAVMARMAGDKVAYMKARPISEPQHVPIVGKRYAFCGMVTSPVVLFEEAGDGWRVETENSVYLCWLDTVENAGIFAKSKGLSDPVTHAGSGSLYWGLDNRLSTYVTYVL